MVLNIPWLSPSKPKIYEAFGAIADRRIRVHGDEATVISSSGGKSYSIKYCREQNAIMSNDNSSYYTGQLGYPSIAYLMEIGEIEFNRDLLSHFKDIKWKDLNQRFRNDYQKTIDLVLSQLQDGGVDVRMVDAEADRILEVVINRKLLLLGERVKPPVGY